VPHQTSDDRSHARLSRPPSAVPLRVEETSRWGRQGGQRRLTLGVGRIDGGYWRADESGTPESASGGNLTAKLDAWRAPRQTPLRRVFVRVVSPRCSTRSRPPPFDSWRPAASCNVGCVWLSCFPDHRKM